MIAGTDATAAAVGVASRVATAAGAARGSEGVLLIEIPRMLFTPLPEVLPDSQSLITSAVAPSSSGLSDAGTIRRRRCSALAPPFPLPIAWLLEAPFRPWQQFPSADSEARCNFGGRTCDSA